MFALPGPRAPADLRGIRALSVISVLNGSGVGVDRPAASPANLLRSPAPGRILFRVRTNAGDAAAGHGGAARLKEIDTRKPEAFRRLRVGSAVAGGGSSRHPEWLNERFYRST